MRFVLALLALPMPATAWEFSFDGICRLSHASPQAELLITYDPSAPEYALSLVLPDAPWSVSPTFEMAFIGQGALSIGTTAHVLALDNSALVVRDRGFGNVLDGLEFNDTAVSRSGETTVTLSLEGAAPEVRKFRACPDTTPPTS